VQIRRCHQLGDAINLVVLALIVSAEVSETDLAQERRVFGYAIVRYVGSEMALSGNCCVAPERLW
jgi:hypothetical protein